MIGESFGQSSLQMLTYLERKLFGVLSLVSTDPDYGDVGRILQSSDRLGENGKGREGVVDREGGWGTGTDATGVSIPISQSLSDDFLGRLDDDDHTIQGSVSPFEMLSQHREFAVRRPQENGPVRLEETLIQHGYPSIFGDRGEPIDEEPVHGQSESIREGDVASSQNRVSFRPCLERSATSATHGYPDFGRLALPAGELVQAAYPLVYLRILPQPLTDCLRHRGLPGPRRTNELDHRFHWSTPDGSKPIRCAFDLVHRPWIWYLRQRSGSSLCILSTTVDPRRAERRLGIQSTLIPMRFDR